MMMNRLISNDFDRILNSWQVRNDKEAKWLEGAEYNEGGDANDISQEGEIEI